MLREKLQKQLQQVKGLDTILVTRMCGHYLNLTAIAEMHHQYAPSHSWSSRSHPLAAHE